MVLDLGLRHSCLSQAAMRSRPRMKLVLFVAFVLVMYLLWFTPLAPMELFTETQFDETSFGQRGVLAQKLYDQMLEADKQMQAEKLAMRLFPFIRHPTHPRSPTPLRSPRSTFTAQSQGIVIPAGKKNIIFARHAILALRDVLNVTLPITIAFAGNEDLSSDEQQSLLDLRPAVEMLDVIATLSDEFMNLRAGPGQSNPLQPWPAASSK